MPVQQHAFEEICTYLMSRLVARNTGYNVKYRILGGRGQPQWGLDVVTDHPKFAPLVGQCKHKQPGSRLTFSEVLKELKKSDEYERPIERFFFLTNSEYDSQLQTKLVGYKHTRPDGTTFEVQLIYWADQDDLSFIPKDKLRLFFPEQAHHARHFAPPPNMESVAAAFEMAPRVLSRWITEDNIHEIVNSAQTLDLGPILWSKLNLFQQAVDGAKLLRLGVSSYAEKPSIRELFRALPAIECFANVLSEYKRQYNDLHGSDPRQLSVMSRCQELQAMANSVSNVYHGLIHGDCDVDNELADLKSHEKGLGIRTVPSNFP